MNIHLVMPGTALALIGNGSDLTEVRESLEAAGVTIAASVSDMNSVEVGGDSQVEWVTSGGNRIPVDAAITAHGVQPDPELVLQALVQTLYSAFSGVHVPVRNETLETTVANVRVAGDAGGICTTAEAAAEGSLAGEAASDGKNIEDLIERLHDVRPAERAAEIRNMQAVTAG
jgi:pyruvate/2-oxoglutarate dehydrogenase complex dihydrolipoamide dehydrogenase (E3) component